MQNLIPYVWQMVFANILVKGWIINSGIQSLFYGSQEVLTFSSHYFKVVNSDIVTCDDRMVMDGGRGLKVFFKPLQNFLLTHQCCFYLQNLLCSWVEFCSGPRLGIYISSRLRLGVVPLFIDVEVKSIWSWPCVVRYLLHYILLEYCDGCPIADISLYGWASYIQ